MTQPLPTDSLVEHIWVYVSVTFDETAQSTNNVIFAVIDVIFILCFLEGQNEGVGEKLKDASYLLLVEHSRWALLDNEVEPVDSSITNLWLFVS